MVPAVWRPSHSAPHLHPGGLPREVHAVAPRSLHRARARRARALPPVREPPRRLTLEQPERAVSAPTHFAPHLQPDPRPPAGSVVTAPDQRWLPELLESAGLGAMPPPPRWRRA